MHKKTKEEIEKFVRELWPSREYSEVKISVRNVSDERVSLTVSKMYDYVDYNIEHIIKLAKFFGTSKIEVDRYGSEGCETCDYGSRYELNLCIEPGPTIEEYLKDSD